MKKFKIKVIVHGQEIVAISDGTEEGTEFVADEVDINNIKYSILRGRKVDITHSRYDDAVEAGYESPLALTAALCSLDEKRSIIWSAPKDVIDFINDGGTCSRIIIEDEPEEN